jgi:hypothetical protein
MPGEKLRIGPTHALRLVLAGAGKPLDLWELREGMRARGVGQERADRAIRRAVKHGQVAANADGSYELAQEAPTW